MADHAAGAPVALFATCLVDLYRPPVGFAAARLLEHAGCQVVVPEGQTCCGQPNYNSGDRANAIAIARHTVALLEPYAAVVVPSGSCAGMLINHYPELLADDRDVADAARHVAGRTWELTAYLTEVCGVVDVPGQWRGRVAYHDSCSCLREVAVAEAPRQLLDRVTGLQLAEPADRDVCCGFGGTFAVKYPEISGRMVDEKATAIEATGAATLVSADMGCLLNIAGRLQRRGSAIACRHIAELLAGTADTPPIGAPG